jgi:hypothetical protein
MEVEGGENESTKKQASERSVNGDSDYGKMEAEDAENGTNEILLWACAILAIGFFLLKIFSAFDRCKRIIFGKNRRR